MAKRKGATATAESPSSQGDAAETPAEGLVNGAAPVSNGTLKANPPVFKCGPIPTRKGESVQGCVWEKEFLTPDGRSYRVHTIEVRASYFSEKDGTWHDSSGFKPSQLSALEFILR